jgi:hypothetical protein
MYLLLLSYIYIYSTAKSICYILYACYHNNNNHHSNISEHFSINIRRGNMVVKVYGSIRAACPQRVLACLIEKGIEFELVHVDLDKGEQKQPQFLLLQVIYSDYINKYVYFDALVLIISILCINIPILLIMLQCFFCNLYLLFKNIN